MKLSAILFLGLMFTSGAFAQEAEREAVSAPDFSRCQYPQAMGVMMPFGAVLGDKGELKYIGDYDDVVRFDKGADKDELLTRHKVHGSKPMEMRYVLDKKDGRPERFSLQFDTSWAEQMKQQNPNFTIMKSMETTFAYRGKTCQVAEAGSRDDKNKLHVTYDRGLCNKVNRLVRQNGGNKKLMECSMALAGIQNLIGEYNRKNAKDNKVVGNMMGASVMEPKPDVFQISPEQSAMSVAASCRMFEIMFDKSPMTEKDVQAPFVMGVGVGMSGGAYGVGGMGKDQGKEDEDKGNDPAR